MSMQAKIGVLGASPKEERYSNKAVKMLLEKGYKVIPIHPQAKEVEGLAVVKNLQSISEKIDTLSIYVAGDALENMSSNIVDLAPRRVIFNPGTENDQLKQLLENNNIETINACTLVLLRTGQF